jgi:hypothetical protein
VGAGELKRLAQREREPEAVDETERECDAPATLHAGRPGDVLDCHVDDRRRNQRLDERREP